MCYKEKIESGLRPSNTGCNGTLDLLMYNLVGPKMGI